MTLENRVAKLEAKMTPPKIGRKNIFVWFVYPGELNQECLRVEHDDQLWERLAGESEDDLKARAVLEARGDDRVAMFFVNR